MSEETQTFQVQSAALTDRGLNERRPLNEDALLQDRERSIFAVADGVGGDEQRAAITVRMLDECRRRHAALMGIQR